MTAHAACDLPRRRPRAWLDLGRVSLMHGGPRRGRPRHHRHDPFGGRHGLGPGFFGRGPRAARGDIRAGILALLAEEPMHGYQMMRELAERSGGVWRPSPGSIYPTLQQLQDEGLVRGEEEAGGRRLFHLTDEGREAAAAATASGAPWDAVADPAGSAAIELRDLVGGVIAAARAVATSGNDAQIRRASEVLGEARRKLYRILAEDETPREPDAQ